MLLQAFDLLELSRRSGCRLQLGGADQCGNILNGVDPMCHTEGKRGVRRDRLAIRRGKMGRKVAGAVWQNEDRLPPLRLSAVLA